MILTKLKLRVRRGDLTLAQAADLLNRARIASVDHGRRRVLEDWLQRRIERCRRKHGLHEWIRRSV